MKKDSLLVYLNALLARNLRLSSVNPLPQEALNLTLSVLAKTLQGTYKVRENKNYILKIKS